MLLDCSVVEETTSELRTDKSYPVGCPSPNIHPLSTVVAGVNIRPVELTPSIASPMSEVEIEDKSNSVDVTKSVVFAISDTTCESYVSPALTQLK